MERLTADAERLIRKMSSTIDDFRKFFRPDKEQRAFSAREQVSAAIDLVRPSFEARGITFRLSAPEDVTLWGVPNEYSQVLLNLLINAKDAIVAAERAQGRIAISADRIFIPKAANTFVCIRVSDNGTVIDERIIGKIFEPYFTTKGDKGTGLGLTTVKEIIEENTGWIEIHAQKGAGTTFTAYLPLHQS